MRNKPAVDVSADAGRIRRNRAARDLDHIECCTAARARSEPAVDVAHRGILEIHRVARAVLRRRLERARARCPAAVGIAVGRAVLERELVRRRRVADDGAPRPDVFAAAARTCGRCIIHPVVGIAVDDDRRRGRRVV